MAGEKYADKAIDALLSEFSTNFATQLAAVETAQSLSASALGRPDEYLEADRDPDDNRALVKVFSESTDEFEGEVELLRHACVVAYLWYGDADFDANSLKARRVLTAMRAVIQNDPVLGNNVVSAVITGTDYDYEKRSDNKARYAAALAVDVITYDG
jgi:hypothetical protein